MTIAKDFASKAGIAFVALAMIFTMSVPASNAQQTPEDLQKMINDLLAQIESLKGGEASATASGYTWTRDLKTGATGADVMELQKFLNSDADTRVAATGVGSAGMETSYFGPATAAAVSKFQVKYRADILSPAGLVNPTGFFGPSTRAKANALNTVTDPTVPDEDGDGSTDEDEDEDEDTTLSGEASLDTFEIEDGESTVDEGDEDVEIGVITAEFTDGDASISRLDITLDGTGSAQPWDAFEEVSLWVDGEEVARVAADDEDTYLDEDAGELRFAGLDIIAMEDEEIEITVAATIQNNLDSTELVDWTLAATALRFFDADGVATTEDSAPVTDDTSTFEVQTAGTDEELGISLSSSNPDTTDVVVDTDTDTNDVTILVADLEANDNDIELNRVVVKVDIANGYSTTTAATVLDDVRLEIDGKTFDAEAVGTEDDYNAAADDDTPSTATGLAEGFSEFASSSQASVWYLFDIDGDVVIDEDSEVAMEVIVDINDTDDAARYPNGTTVKASVTSTETNEWTAEGADDLANSQFDGSAVGDEMTLVAEGIVVPVEGFSSEVKTLGTNDTTGEFTLEFEVKAIEGDFYITDNATDAASTTLDDGIGYTVTGGTATVTASLTSTADEDTSGVFTVREGETETFTLVVTVDPVSTGVFRVELDEVYFSASANGTNATEVYLPTPEQDFRTATKSVNG